MAKFRIDERDDILVEDDAGDLDYHDALSAIVEHAVATIEGALWEMVDELEYVVAEETDQPTNFEEDDDDNYVEPDEED